MRKLFNCFAATAAFLLVSSPMAVVSGGPVPLNSPKIMIPSMPALPQEENILCGDVNEDSFVNVLDIISMVNYIMGGNPSPFNQDAADINDDNGINVLDVIAIVNIIMQVPGLPCGCVAPVNYEGHTYATVQVGGQCWFRENIIAGTMIMSNEGGQMQADNGLTEKYCYNNDVANCDIYGGLYEWNEAMQYTTAEGAQGICPLGWHIPSDEEWKELEGTVDSQYSVGDPIWDEEGSRGFDAGGHLKEAGTVHWNAPNTGATNSSGFTTLPGGERRIFFGDFDDLGMWSYFWTSTEYDATYAWRRHMASNEPLTSRYYYHKNLGFSVRCLKGCWPQPTQANAGPDQPYVPCTCTLAGNTPVYGTGVWHVISGTGGILADTLNPTSNFEGLAGNAYSLTWTISTACESKEDTVVISFMAGVGLPCPGIPTVTYEGQTYNTVQICDQCWLRENLNVGTMIISNTGGQLQLDNEVIEKYCYNNDAANCDVYGGLYEWNEMMQYVTTEGAQGICPVGWHIPTDGQWKILEGTVDSQYPVGDPVWDEMYFRGFDAGGNLKEAGTTHWNSPNTGASNSSGFTALPGGNRKGYNGEFVSLGMLGWFWSSSHLDPSNIWYRHLGYTSDKVYRYAEQIHYGRAVRCLKD